MPPLPHESTAAFRQQAGLRNIQIFLNKCQLDRLFVVALRDSRVNLHQLAERPMARLALGLDGTRELPLLAICPRIPGESATPGPEGIPEGISSNADIAARRSEAEG